MAAVLIVMMDVVLELRRTVETNLIRVSYHCVSYYFHISIPFKWLYTSNKMDRFSYKSEREGRGHTRIEVFKSRASLGYR